MQRALTPMERFEADLSERFKISCLTPRFALKREIGDAIRETPGYETHSWSWRPTAGVYVTVSSEHVDAARAYARGLVDEQGMSLSDFVFVSYPRWAADALAASSRS